VAQVDGHRALVAAQGAEQQRRVAGVQPPAPELVPGARALDLDDVGAEVGQQAAGGGCGDEVPEFDHPDAGQWPVCSLMPDSKPRREL
jgi:hypothetical protein